MSCALVNSDQWIRLVGVRVCQNIANERPLTLVLECEFPRPYDQSLANVLRRIALTSICIRAF